MVVARPRPKKTRFPSMREALVVDQFAGGGGASLGVEIAIGRSPILEITEPAIALHVPGEGLCILTDITLRMLQPRELARSMSFPDDYKLTGSKSNQVAKIGNSVPPLLVAQIVAANMGKAKRARKKKAA